MLRRLSLIVTIQGSLAGVLLGSLAAGPTGCSHNAQTRAQAPEETELVQDFQHIMTIGTVTDVSNARPIQVSGVGLVSGLDGTGGLTPNGLYRKMLEDELRRMRVENVKELLNSPNHSLVLVTGLIPAGAHKGDPIDIEVSLPPGSKTTSLRGGYLHDCILRDYDSTKNINPQSGPDKLLAGNILGKAKGPIHVGFGDGDEIIRLKRGRIWEGGVCYMPRPFYLVLKNDQKFAKVSAAVADRINLMFPDDPIRRQQVLRNKRLVMLDEVTTNLNQKFQAAPVGRRETAHAINKEAVSIHVPETYRLNAERYLRVARLIPMRETPEVQGKYLVRLERNLLDPGKTLQAALRLEALGRDSQLILQKGLKHEHPLVRFACAESLAYLGSSGGGVELARLAEQHPVLRIYCLTALASLDETISRDKLVELLANPAPELRFGAFRALRVLDEWSPDLHGELLADSFWLHRVAPNSTPMVAYATSRRAEIVCFGPEAKLMGPMRLLVGSEFTITAEAGDDRCTVSRFSTAQGSVQRKLCSFRLADVLRTMAALGAQYNDAVALLGELDRKHCLSCPVKNDPLPEAIPVQVLAAAGAGDDRFQNHPDVHSAVQAARDDLGVTPAMFRRD